MSSKKNSKTAGKIFAAFTIIILIAVLVISAFIKGQTRAAEKHFSAIASGSYADYEDTVSPYTEISFDIKDDFRQQCRAWFSQMPQFSELGENDIISSKIKIHQRRMNGSPDKWLLTADVDFYSGGESVSYNDIVIEAVFESGKWFIRHDTEILHP